MMPLAGSATGFANPSATSLATLRENPLQGWQHSKPYSVKSEDFPFGKLLTGLV